MKKLIKKQTSPAKKVKAVVPPAYIYRLTNEWGSDKDDALNPRL